MTQLRKVARKCSKEYYRDRDNETWQNFVRRRQLLKKEIRREKRSSWKKFTEQSSDIKDVSRLYKIVQAREDTQVGILSDSTTDGPEGTLNKLVDTHFLGSVRRIGWDPGPKGKEGGRYQDALHSGHFTTTERIRWAIKQFGNTKAAGPDGIKPIVLKNLPDNYLENLKILFVCSLQAGYVPYRWRQSKVIFIPKPGKEDYSKAKVFRPITLSSFIFKMMERVVLNYLEVEQAIYSKLNTNQHAFRKGSSCDSALSSMVNEIERPILNNQYALAIFLDIAGAFDNLNPMSCIRGMQQKGIPPRIADWYGHYLQKRTVKTSQRDNGQQTPDQRHPPGWHSVPSGLEPRL